MLTQIELLRKYEIRVRGHLGQHLLIDPNLQRKIVELAEPKAGEPILEIGPGLGALTALLLECGCDVWAVEKDKKFVEVLEKELGEEYPGRLHVIHGDILKLKLDQIIPKRTNKKSTFKVVSNLPYYITAPTLFHLLDYREVVERAILMMQKEVAQRFIAEPGSKHYGRITLAMRYAASIRHAFDVSAGCFTPKPEVASSVLVLNFHPRSQLLKQNDEKELFDLIQVAFSQRRKTLLHLLTAAPEWKQVGREGIKSLFRGMGLKETVRGEELLLKDYLELKEKLYAQKKS